MDDPVDHALGGPLQLHIHDGRLPKPLVVGKMDRTTRWRGLSTDN